jgi:hypothetical protein
MVFNGEAFVVVGVIIIITIAIFMIIIHEHVIV